VADSNTNASDREANRLNPRPGWLDPEQARGLAALDTAPEFLLGGQEEMLVEGIRMDGHFHPFPSACDDRQHRRPGIGDPHVVLQLRHVLFGGGFLREGPGQHELGFEHGAAGINQAVQGCRHPLIDGMLDPALGVLDRLAGVALIPAPVEVLGDGAELDDQVAGEVLRL
jgi:hypothetical protein